MSTAAAIDAGRLGDVDTADREAFDAFARARTPALLRFAHVLTGDPDKAADLVQDALERTVAAWPRVVRKDDPEGYVRRAIVHRNVSVWRRTRARDPRQRRTGIVLCANGSARRRIVGHTGGAPAADARCRRPAVLRGPR